MVVLRMTFRRLLEVLGLVLLVAGSLFVATRLTFALMIRAAGTSELDRFAVVCMLSQDRVALRRFPSLDARSGEEPVMTYLIPISRVQELNAALAQQYTGHGGAWTFEVLADDGQRQYIRVSTSGESQLIDSWYWATATAVEPDRVRQVNRSVLLAVVPLAGLFTSCAVIPYIRFRRRAAVEGRPN